MKVGLDISQMAHDGGVSTYTKNLAERLTNFSDLEMNFLYSSLRKPYHGNLPNVKSFPLPPTLFEKLFNDWRFIPVEKFIGEIDIFHSSDWIQPPTKAKKITTYHDVVPLKYPQWSHPKIIEVHRKRLSLVEKEVDMVIAVSESTKKDLLEISSIPEEKIVVIHEAADEIFKPQDEKEIEEYRKKKGLPKEFILALGGVGERKNLGRIKEASVGYNLIVAGEDIPRVPLGELPLLYSAAKVLLYPSLYEGFGLPILESMAVGTPIITSNVSSIPEVGGEAAVYVDPQNGKDMKEKLEIVMKDQKLWEVLRGKGFVQSQKFSWDRCAKETAAVYHTIYKGS